MSTEIYDIELPKLSSEKHDDKTFKLVAIMDMTINTEKRFYRLLFKHIDSPMYIIEEVAPELLFSFSTGSYYKNSYPVKDKVDGEFKEIPLSGSHYNIVRIRDFIKDDEFDFDHKITMPDGIRNFANEIKDQYCIVYKVGHETVILPCHLIGEKFFFVSTNLRRRIFDSRPEKLYESINYENGKPIIRLKAGVAVADGSYLVHFHQHKYANDSWHSILDSLNRELYESASGAWHVPLKIPLPFKNRINISVRYSQLPNNKILIHEIEDHESFFSFSNIKVITPGRNDDEDREEPRQVIPQKNRRKNKKLNQKPPSSHNTYAGIRNKIEETRLKYNGVVVEHEVENDNEKTNVSKTTEHSNESTNISSLSPVYGGDENTSHLNANQDNDFEKKNKKKSNKCQTLFTRNHFEQIYNTFSDNDDIKNLQLYTDEIYPKRIGVENCNLKETYDKNCNNRRRWHYMSFMYKKKYIVIIDLDQNGLPNGSSFFVLWALNPIYKSNINQLLKDYASKKTIKAMKIIFKSKGITFIPRNHKCPNMKGHAKIWGHNLLKMLSQ